MAQEQIDVKETSDIQTPSLTRNNVYLMAGITTSTSATTLVYERNLVAKPKGELNLRFGVGLYQFSWSSEGVQLLSTLSYIKGYKNHHFESAFGICYLSDVPGSSLNVYPAGYLGYRYKKPNGKFMFRAGAGWPDQLGFGAGYCF